LKPPEESKKKKKIKRFSCIKTDSHREREKNTVEEAERKHCHSLIGP